MENPDFKRGTKVIIHLKAECRDFSRAYEIGKIIKKYSNFISYTIKLNGEIVNNIQAIWYRERKDISAEDYQTFYEAINNNTKLPYKYMIHFQSEVPLEIRSILYIPSNNSEKFGRTEEESIGINLYSKRILIKPSCRELLPPFLRFVKGVVDCSDLPLSISRENYQDSSLIFKLKMLVTKRILKKLEDEIRVDSENYDKWYDDFGQYLKEGLLTDNDHRQTLMKLQRFKLNLGSTSKRISIDDYVAKMLPNQKKIYFLVVPNDSNIEGNIFLESYRDEKLPVLICNNPVDEMIFQQIRTYNEFTFLNLENENDDFLDAIKKNSPSSVSKIPDNDVTAFTLWLKNELQPYVEKVTLSKRLKDSPLIVASEMSANMKGFLSIMSQEKVI